MYPQISMNEIMSHMVKITFMASEKSYSS